jgi:DNA-binding NarL/FixJ family response regulator
MELWNAVGGLWDQAFDGQAAAANSKATHLADLTDDPAERAILLAFVSICEILLCRYEDATATAERAADRAADATGDGSADAQFFAESVRILTSAMLDPEISGVKTSRPLPQLARLQEYAATISMDRPERLLLVHPVIEASMSFGHFAVVDDLIAAQRPFSVPEDHFSRVVGPTLEVILARALAFSGELDRLVTHCESVFESPELELHPQTVMTLDALLCFAAGQRGDRDEVELRSSRALAEARRTLNYMSVGSCLLVSWSLATIGQLQRASALLLGVCGGPELSRIKTWDRAVAYDVLVEAALRRGDLASARSWADRAATLAPLPAASAAAERALARFSAATGDLADAVLRARLSAKLDELSGAKLDELSDRMLYASALAASGQRELAVETLTAVRHDADALGAASISALAKRERRSLLDTQPSLDGGFGRLTQREKEIAILVAEGHTNKSIGNTLFLSERTVQTHLSHILRVMELPSRTAIPAALGVGREAVDAPPLTARQEEVARLIAKGHANAHIARELGISVKTVENHLAGIFTRWQVSSRTAVANLLVARDGAESKRARTT